MPQVQCSACAKTLKVADQAIGITLIDGDFPIIPDEGIIALQHFAGPAGEVIFRNIAFRELPPPADGGKQ